MNIVMRGVLPTNIKARNADTLETDWPYFNENDPINSYDPLYVDAVVSNPPYSQAWNPADKESDPRYARFGLAPKTKADFAFLLHDLYHLKPDGVMAIVLPHGVLFRGGAEGKIRRNLIEQNHIDTIIGLPANIFFGTGIPTVIMILKQKREHNDVLVIDASKGFLKVGKDNQLQAAHIKKIVDTVISRKSTAKFSKVVPLAIIQEQDYNLNIPRYVDSSANPENWDIHALLFGGIPNAEIEELSAYWQAFPTLKQALFIDKGTPYCQLATAEIKETIAKNVDVLHFVAQFTEKFADFSSFLKHSLIDEMLTLNLNQAENTLSAVIFTRLHDIALVDPYQAYQFFYDEWKIIEGDLEIIQSPGEGLNAARKVIPNIVTKKKDGKDVEVQEGWLGYILPFALVQSQVLPTQLNQLKTTEQTLSDTSAALEELIDSFNEEEKENRIFNEAQTGFNTAELKAALKDINADLKTQPTGFSDDSDSFEAKVLQASTLLMQEKTLKVQLKKETDSLHALTKTTIEALDDTQLLDLLEAKWIAPVVSAIAKLPSEVMTTLTLKTQQLADKYAKTYTQTTQQLKDSEHKLADLMADLNANEFDALGIAKLQDILRQN